MESDDEFGDAECAEMTVILQLDHEGGGGSDGAGCGRSVTSRRVARNVLVVPRRRQ